MDEFGEFFSVLAVLGNVGRGRVLDPFLVEVVLLLNFSFVSRCDPVIFALLRQCFVLFYCLVYGYLNVVENFRGCRCLAHACDFVSDVGLEVGDDFGFVSAVRCSCKCFVCVLFSVRCFVENCVRGQVVGYRRRNRTCCSVRVR